MCDCVLLVWVDVVVFVSMVFGVFSVVVCFGLNFLMVIKIGFLDIFGKL